MILLVEVSVATIQAKEGRARTQAELVRSH